jgi:putative ABC transport system permease protein
MGLLKGFLVRVRALARRGIAERELDDELRFHLEMETEKNIRLGMTPDDARRQALLVFGGVEQAKEAHRDVRGATLLEELLGDTRFALRTLRRSPALAGAAIVTLALGIGANAAIFAAVNAVILRPLPFADPERLYALGENNAEKNWHMETSAPANFLDWRERVPAFRDIAAYSPYSPRMTLAGLGTPRLLTTAIVTGNFFTLFGVRPALGRGFVDQETWKNGAHVAVLSHRGWTQQFGGDPAIVGRFIRLEGQSVQIVGVMPESFAFPQEAVDIWAPTEWDPANRGQIFFRRAHWMRPIARLAPAVSREQAEAQFQQVVERLKQEFPVTNRVMGAGMVPLHEYLVGDTRLPLLVLLGSVGLLLLIACANVGNLLLVQAAGRERELSVRVALGASRRRIVRQALTESLVLSGIGGLAGLATGWAGTRALVALQPEGMLRVRDFGVDWQVFGYVLALTTLSGLLFGIAPAIAGGRRMPADALREGGRSGTGGRRMRRWGDALVVGEVALALMLTIGAGLLVRSFWVLRHVHPGFDPNGVLTVAINLPDATYDSSDKIQLFFDGLIARVRALPGVTDAALTSPLPLTGSGYTSDYSIASHPRGEYGTEVAHRRVSTDYFKTMHVPILQGRDFTAADTRTAPSVVLINDALARKSFRGENPIGQRIANDRDPDSTTVWHTIIGVVGSEHLSSLSIEPKVEIFSPSTQDETSVMTVVARTSGDPASLAPGIRQVVAEMDGNLALGAVRPMSEVHAKSLARERFLTTLLLVFAGVGVTLAVIGVYGVLAQLARRRTREMGIRIALGAPVGQVRWLVVRHGLRLVAVGLAIGTTLALVATRGLQTLLYHVAPADPLTFVAVPVLLTLTGIVAAWLPAVQASRADPAIALRAE